MPTKTKPKGKAKSAATKPKRTMYVVQQAGPGRLYHLWVYREGESLPWFISEQFDTQRVVLRNAISEAKRTFEAEGIPHTIYVQNKHGKYRLVNSYPRVVNRKKVAK